MVITFSAESIGQQRLRDVKAAANSFWKRYRTLENLHAKYGDVWEELDLTPAFDPERIENDRIESILAGSGGMSTGEFSLEVTNDSDWQTKLKYVLILSNSGNKAVERLSEQYNVPFVREDFELWYRDHHDPNSEKPIRDTKIFYHSEAEDRPSNEELERRLKIRQEFDSHLRDLVLDKLGYMPQSISARGYSFPFTTNFAKEEETFIDDTHPADATYVDPESLMRLYSGFLSEPVKLMKRNSHRTYRGSLFVIKPLTGMETLNTVDEGELLAVGQGLIPPADWKSKKIQGGMKHTEDCYTIALYASVLAPLLALSNEPKPVQYNTIGGAGAFVNQKEVYIGNIRFSGKDAFGQNPSDLKLLSKI